MMNIRYWRWFLLVLLAVPPFGVDAQNMPPELPSGPLSRYAENPLVRNGPEKYDFWKTGPRVVLKVGPADYRMWYEAVGADTLTCVALATSRDGLSWTKKGVVMSPSGMDTWEKKEVSPNSILVVGGSYRMWYHAGGYPEGSRRMGKAAIGLATSPDGFVWTRHAGNPVLETGPAGSIDELQVAEPRVLQVGKQLRMYYTAEDAGKRKSLCMATSTDGIGWIKSPGNPVLLSERWGGWGGAFLFEDGVWHLWHAERDDMSGLRYKWSRDGLAWSDGPSVLVPSSDPKAPDLAAGDSVSGYRDAGTYRILYSGANMKYPTGRLEAVCMATIEAKSPLRRGMGEEIPGAGLLFRESFDDADLPARGWYDGTKFTISKENPRAGKGCIEYRWNEGRTTPESSGGIRHRFPPTSIVYLRYWIKLSRNWGWSGRDYHPHLAHFLTTENGEYHGPASSHLTLYIEPVNGKLRLGATDMQNADAPHGLTQGPLRGGYNGKLHDSQETLFKDDGWHCVEAMFKLNSVDVKAGTWKSDGELRGWFDGKLVIEHTDVLFRTVDFSDMQFNQFLLTPYFGPGLLPHAQTLWIDELAVGKQRLGFSKD
jgi:predicted GH43/DUF377 family glycosyl hydrolase